MSDLNIVFAGTPEFAAGHLSALLAHNYAVSAVYTQPDRKAGRGKKLQASAVKQVALAHDLPVHQPLNFKDQADIDALAAQKPDLLVVVAYGLLLPQAVLDIPKYGCINVHASILPRWRGAAPIERAIEAGDAETGVTIMQMDIGLDTGDMLNIKKLPITASTTGDSLREELMQVGTPALLESIDAIANGQSQGEKQNDDLACYAKKLSKEEAAIDWQQSAEAIDRKIRAFNSANVNVAHFNEERIKFWQTEVVSMTEVAADEQASANDKKPGEILAITKKFIDVACAEGILRLRELQLPNAKRMPVHAILNGKKDFFSVGQCFE